MSVKACYPTGRTTEDFRDADTCNVLCGIHDIVRPDGTTALACRADVGSVEGINPVGLEKNSAVCLDKEDGTHIYGNSAASNNAVIAQALTVPRSLAHTRIEIQTSELDVEICADVPVIGEECDLETVRVRGELEVYGLPCQQGSCPIIIRNLIFDSTSFRIGSAITGVDDHNVTGPIIRDALELQGTIDSRGLFSLPTDSTNFAVAARVDGSPKRVVVRPSSPITGLIDFDRRTFRVALTLSTEGASISGTLNGTLTNRPPVANAGTEEVVECSGPQTTIKFDGSRSFDPDHDDLSYQWLLDPGLTNSLAPSATVEVPQGIYQGELLVTDGIALDTDTTQIEVVDSQPPLQTREPFEICLFPPNHEFFSFDVEALGMAFEDQCDPSPSIEIVDIVSNQPENGRGDGEFSGDIRFDSTAACVRSERDGRDLSGRTYTVVVKAVDRRGNQAITEVLVRVGHDGSDEQCRPFLWGSFVSENDVVCDLPVPPPLPNAEGDDTGDGRGSDIGPHVHSSSSSGCSLAGRRPPMQGSLGVLIFIGSLILLFRRRSRREMGALIISLVCAGCITGCSDGDIESRPDDSPSSLQGTWWTKPQGACEVYCEENSELIPECDKADCRIVALTSFREREAVSVTISLSREARVFSRFAPLSRRTYELRDHQIHYPDQNTTSTYEIRGDELILNGQNSQAASAELAQALDQALSTDAWTRVSY